MKQLKKTQTDLSDWLKTNTVQQLPAKKMQAAESINNKNQKCGGRSSVKNRPQWDDDEQLTQWVLSTRVRILK